MAAEKKIGRARRGVSVDVGSVRRAEIGRVVRDRCHHVHLADLHVRGLLVRGGNGIPDEDPVVAQIRHVQPRAVAGHRGGA